MFGQTKHSAEIGHIYRTRSAVLAEHSSVCRTIVRIKNSSVRLITNDDDNGIYDDNYAIHLILWVFYRVVRVLTESSLPTASRPPGRRNGRAKSLYLSRGHNEPSKIILISVLNAIYPITCEVVHKICTPVATLVRVVIFERLSLFLPVGGLGDDLWAYNHF